MCPTHGDCTDKDQVIVSRPILTVKDEENTTGSDTLLTWTDNYNLFLFLFAVSGKMAYKNVETVFGTTASGIGQYIHRKHINFSEEITCNIIHTS